MPNPKRVVRVDPHRPDAKVMKQAGKIIRDSGVVIFPAQCLYGVAADAADPVAVEKVFSLKQRPKDNPILVLVATPADIAPLVKAVPAHAGRLMDAFWPGRITLVFEAAPKVSPVLTAGTGRIGIRVPFHPVAKALVESTGRPITGTSANLSGEPGAARTDHLPASMVQGADLVLDAGPVQGGAGSTIVDVTTTPVAVLREGAVSADAVKTALKSGPGQQFR